MDIEFLRPTGQHRVMDLVEAAGIDVSDWENCKGGLEKAAMNPKYCYEWTYRDEEKKLLALNLWFKNTKIADGKISQKVNLRVVAAREDKPLRKRRAIDMDLSLQKGAWMDWEIRIIMLDGAEDFTRADRRSLDVEPWHVESYSSETGDCLLVRGVAVEPFIDQFAITQELYGNPEKRQVTSSAYNRCPSVRRYALNRAQGRCEWCDEIGFETLAGSIYLETHHIIPLSENGDDSIDNVIAICPNHHREAHYGLEADRFRKILIERVKTLNTR